MPWDRCGAALSEYLHGRVCKNIYELKNIAKIDKDLQVSVNFGSIVGLGEHLLLAEADA